MPVKNHVTDKVKWKKDMYLHFCQTDPTLGCTFREFTQFLDEMNDVHLRNTMRDYVKALYKSLKVLVRFFYKAAGKTAEGVQNECPVKLTLSEFMNL